MSKYLDPLGNEIIANSYEEAMQKLLDWNGLFVEIVEEVNN